MTKQFTEKQKETLKKQKKGGTRKMTNLFKNKQEKGITLIALIVTIIILLILAGISIAMLTGQNGILNRASEAKNLTGTAQTDEGVKIAVGGALADGLGTIHQKDLDKELKERFDIYTIQETEDAEAYHITVTKDKIPYTIANNGKISNKKAGSSDGETLVSQIKSENYGDTINYSANGINDWKVFYNDGKNVYIIASDYVPAGKVNTTNTNILTANVSEDYDIAEYPYNVWWDYDTMTGKDANSPNKEVVKTLTNANSWVEFAKGVKDATATGAPTLEMWVNSWNAKHGNSSNDEAKRELYYGSDDSGYYVGTEANPEVENEEKDKSYYVELAEKTGYADTLYFPHQGRVSNCYGYWLASPSASIADDVMNVDYRGYVDGNNFNIPYDGGVRPVVCLPSELLGKSETAGEWTIVEE